MLTDGNMDPHKETEPKMVTAWINTHNSFQKSSYQGGKEGRVDLLQAGKTKGGFYFGIWNTGII